MAFYTAVVMVYILDEGSVFDAPIDKIWKYLRSDEHRHNSMKLISREMVNGNAVIITAERNILGKMVRTKIKNTLYPPFGFVQEHLEGPTAGSRAFVYYIPKGNKTGITIVGEFVLSGMDEKVTREAVMAQYQVTFDEDNANLKNTKET
ncbi:MAG TPA: hypothetical protein VEC43_03760 [Candidatus Acidoferrales bacterium]|nr:hypothetical protein [Candidatus Acidoferrales bacterium]